jgi:plasmid replication initiation protein
MGRKPIKSDQAQLLFEGLLGPGETITAAQPERSALVREAKEELSFASDLNLRQMKLLTYLLAMAAEKGSKKFPAAYRINIPHYAAFTGLTASNLYSEIKEVATSLQKTLVYYFDEVDPIDGQPLKKLSGTWIRYVAEPLRDSHLTVVLDEKVRERLESLRTDILKGQYSIYQLYQLLQLSSVYSIHLYRWAKHQPIEENVVVELRDLRMILHAYREAGGKMLPILETWDKLRRRALDPAIEEIDADMDLKISYKALKKSGSKAVESVAFYITSKATPKLAHIPVELSQGVTPEQSAEPATSDELAAVVDSYVREFRLKRSQESLITAKGQTHGIEYLHAQAKVARKRPPANRSGAFHKACEHDWAKFLGNEPKSPASASRQPFEGSDRQKKLTPIQKKLIQVEKAGFYWQCAAQEFDPKAFLPDDILRLERESAEYILDAFERERRRSKVY